MTLSSTEQHLRELFRRLAPNEGCTQSLLDGVRFMRADRPVARTPVLYEPSIVIVCQGRKWGFLGDEVYLYDAQHFLVLALPLPFFSETEASPDEPMLAVSIRLDLVEVADLVVKLGQGDVPAKPPAGIASTPLSEALSNATLRLLESLTSPMDARILAPDIVREICYRVLVGEQGEAIRAALANQGQFGRISRALEKIHSSYSQALNVTGLASESGMSVAAFHSHFKSITRSSPIQYIKAIRLHEARLMMIRENLTAAAASARVGYESPSQFSREFRRYFGRTPSDEARDMKALFALLPPTRLAAAMRH